MKRLVSILLVSLLMITTMSVSSMATTDTSQKENNVDSNHPELTQKQKDVLLAYGINEKQISNISYNQIAEILSSNRISRPKYIEKYLPNQEMIKKQTDAITKQIIDEVQAKNNVVLTEKEIGYFIRHGKTIEDIKSMDKSNLLASTQSISIQSVYPSLSNFRRFDASSLDLVKTFPTYEYFSPESLTSTFSSVATSSDVSDMNYNIQLAGLIASNIFQISFSSLNLYNYAYNIYGQLYGGNGTTYFDGLHEGIDVTRYDNAPIYTFTPGEVISTNYYSGRDHTVAVYNSTYEKTFLYLHLKNTSVNIGDYVSFGDQIGTQGSYSDNKHVHFEVANGYRSGDGYSPNNLTQEAARPYPWAMFFG